MLKNINNFKKKDFKYVILKDISYSYKNKKILNKISFYINYGEIICLLGRSGSGKSTLLRLIAGVETLKLGTIIINNKVIVNEKIFIPPEKRQIGMVFQNYALFPHLTVLKNIMFGQKYNKNITRKEGLKQLSYIGLSEYANSYPNTLSGGQQQRVALARTLITKPSILLLDEPFSGLDLHLREKLRSKTKKIIKKNNISTIFVTHDAEEALYLADTIILLNNSKIEQIDNPYNILNNPKTTFVAHYLRHYNEINVEIINKIVKSPFGNFNIDKLHYCSKSPLEKKYYKAKLLISENDIHLENDNSLYKFDHKITVKITEINLFSEFLKLHLIIENLTQYLILRTNLKEKNIKVGDIYSAFFNYKNLCIFI